jgi:hypothetical protein
MSATSEGSISKALQDVIKFFIMSHVDTGDRAFNSVIITFLSLISCYIFTLSWYDIKKFLCFWVRKSVIVDLKIEEEFNKYIKIFKESKTNYFSIKYKNQDFYLSLYHYTMDTIGNYFTNSSDYNYDLDLSTLLIKRSKRTKFYDNDVDAKDNYFDFLYISPAPLYISNKGMIWISAEKLYYTDTSILYEFINIVMEYAKTISHRKKLFRSNECDIQNIGIYKISLTKHDVSINNIIKIGELYKDIVFDKIVSKYKEVILKYLDNFINVNSCQALDRKNTNYNFGAIFHGIGGTGKTMFCKAIANYLNRSILIIDMRKIKTVDMFEKIFLNKDIIDKYVIVLDEFDFIQGIIKDRSQPTETKNQSSIDSLKDRQIQLLSILATSSDSKEDNDSAGKKIILEELNTLNKKIEDEENVLTLDTLLTLFDGIVEMRNRCIIATTNYIDRIDSALIREGRFDLKLELSKYTGEEIRDFLKYFFNSSDNSLSHINFVDNKYTPAQIVNIANTSGSLQRCIELLKI